MRIAFQFDNRGAQQRIIFITARRKSDFESIVWRVSDSQIHYRVV